MFKEESAPTGETKVYKHWEYITGGILFKGTIDIVHNESSLPTAVCTVKSINKR